MIAPQDCGGFVFETQGAYSGSRYFRDFQLIGTGCERETGISIDLPASSQQRITGIIFSGVTIQNFRVGVFCRGLWNAAFLDCFLYNNGRGYHLHGQNVLNSIHRGFVQRGSIAAAGTSFGVLVDSVDGESCQSLHLEALGVYGYDINVSLTLALYTTIDNCDLSVATSMGLQLATAFMGTSIRDCWIQTNGHGATTGIQLADIGSPIADKVVIEGCVLECNVPHGQSVGIYVGANHAGVTTNNNTIGGANHAFATAILNVGARAHVAKYNSLTAGTAALLLGSAATDAEIGPNMVLGGAPLAFSAAPPRNMSFFGSGVFDLHLEGTASPVGAEASWVADGRMVYLSVGPEPITGESNSTRLTGTGIPRFLAPSVKRTMPARVIDSGAEVEAEIEVDPQGVITFRRTGADAGFAPRGVKGLPASSTLGYLL